jgi:hypothetical protein
MLKDNRDSKKREKQKERERQREREREIIKRTKTDTARSIDNH